MKTTTVSADRQRLGMAVCLLGLLCFIGCEQSIPGHSTFKSGRNALQQGNFSDTIAQLNSYLDDYPQGALASRASFLIAKAHMGEGKLDQARQQFEKTIRDYPDSEEAHKSRYKLAVVSLLQGENESARDQFQKLIDNSPGTLVPEAKAMVVYLDDLKNQ